MKIQVKDLRPNPFRDLKRYPVDAVKVDALVASIKETDFWDNLVARKDADGGYELAYGVHRLAALKKAHVEEVDIPVRKLSDTLMIKMMALENQEEWSANAAIAQETIRAIVKAFADGKIELPKTGRINGAARRAPSFQPVGKTDESASGRQEALYSAVTLSKFLGGAKAGWVEAKVEAILSALAATEQSIVDESAFEGLSVYQAEMVARQTRRVIKETKDEKLAKSIGKRLADGMRSATGRRPGVGWKKNASERQSITYHGAAEAADAMMGRDKLEKFCKRQNERDVKKRHQQFNRQVADYINAMNGYRAALKLAVNDVERFAPEAVQYVVGRHTEIRKLINEFEDVLKTKKAVA